MLTTALGYLEKDDFDLAPVQASVNARIEALINSLPQPTSLSASQRRAILARYTAVLEGNFIYWMTAAYLSVKSDFAKSIIIDNLLEEVRDSHPVMLRKFAIAADSFPTVRDSLVVHDNLNKVRLFLGELSGVQTLATMAFFEGFIQQFMPFLAELARLQGSSEFEYTDVHGICDIAHTDGLFRALQDEMMVTSPSSSTNMLKGLDLLERLLNQIVYEPESLAA